MTIPSTQTVMAIAAAGGPEVLQPRTVPVPDAGEGGVLIEVHAAGINRHDWNQRQRGPTPAHSDVPGLEVAGRIAAIGPGVRGLSVGQRVCALSDGGGYAPWCVVPAALTFVMPDHLPWTQAAAWPEAMFTVWHNMRDVAALAPGERVLIHGGTSGVGTAAIQMLRFWGHEVYVTCGTLQKCEVARALGATGAFLYRAPDIDAQLRAALGERGVDVVLDLSGAQHSALSLNVLAHRGRIVHLSPGSGAKFDVPLRDVMAKQAVITGSLLRPVPLAQKSQIAHALRRSVWPAVCEGQLQAVLQKVYPLHDVVQAHEDMALGEHIGKLVLTMPQENAAAPLAPANKRSASPSPPANLEDTPPPSSAIAALGEWARALRERDLLALDTLLGSHMHYVHSTGLVHERGAYLDFVKHGPQFITVDPRVTQTLALGSTVILRGLLGLTLRRAHETEARALQSWFLQVWQWDQGRWQMFSAQTTAAQSYGELAAPSTAASSST